MQILIYLLAGFISFLIAIIPVPGSFITNPILALFLDPYTAVSISAFFFLLNSIVKAFVFRRDIQYQYIKGILPLAIAGSVAGAFSVGLIPEKILLFIIFSLSLYFLLKTIHKVVFKPTKIKTMNNYMLSVMSLLSGFLQGTGLGSGGGLRKSYLLAENLTIAQMNGTASAISVWILLSSVVVRLATNQVDLVELVPVFYIIPAMVIGTILARTALKKINNKTSDAIIITTMTIITFLFGYKIF